MSIRKRWISLQQKGIQRLRKKTVRQNESYHSDLQSSLLGGISPQELFLSPRKNARANAKLRGAKNKDMGRVIRRMRESKGKGIE